MAKGKDAKKAVKKKAEKTLKEKRNEKKQRSLVNDKQATPLIRRYIHN